MTLKTLCAPCMQGARKIDYAGFERALPLLAAEKGAACDDVRRAIVLSGGPRRNSAVKADAFVRLHDDKSTFTGVSPCLAACWCTRKLCCGGGARIDWCWEQAQPEIELMWEVSGRRRYSTCHATACTTQSLPPMMYTCLCHW